jgi:hypothetical protein
VSPRDVSVSLSKDNFDRGGMNLGNIEKNACIAQLHLFVLHIVSDFFRCLSVLLFLFWFAITWWW